MPRVIPDDRLAGAKDAERAYEPPSVPPKPEAKPDDSVRLVTELLNRLPGMIASSAKAPIVHVEAKPPDVRVTNPVYVTPPEIRIPQAPAVNIPEGRAPVVNIEPPVVNLTVSRPKKWKFTVHRNELGQITIIDAEAV
jgi:hypothetical protein